MDNILIYSRSYGWAPHELNFDKTETNLKASLSVFWNQNLILFVVTCKYW